MDIIIKITIIIFIKYKTTLLSWKLWLLVQLKKKKLTIENRLYVSLLKIYLPIESLVKIIILYIKCIFKN